MKYKYFIKNEDYFKWYNKFKNEIEIKQIKFKKKICVVYTNK